MATINLERRGYKGQVFMTPQVNKENPISLGVGKKEDKNGKAKGEVGANHRKEVQDFLNPFAQDSNNDASKPTAGTNILALLQNLCIEYILKVLLTM